MNERKVTWEQDGAVAVITINNPPANALSVKVSEQLEECFREIENEEAVRAVVITGAGERFFMAGADISEFPALTRSEAGYVSRQANRAHEIFKYIDFFPKPVIAAVQGMALGGGCELVLCCDFCIASVNAQFGLPEIKLGLFPGGGGTQRLPRRIGELRAKELMFTGKFINAKEAVQIGLINEAVAADEVLNRAMKKAAELAEQPAVSIRLIKQCVDRGLEVSLEEGLRIEADLFEQVFRTEDVREGVTAFMEKREARFKHR